MYLLCEGIHFNFLIPFVLFVFLFRVVRIELFSMMGVGVSLIRGVGILVLYRQTQPVVARGLVKNGKPFLAPVVYVNGFLPDA